MIPALATVNEILYRRTLFEGPNAYAGNSHQRFCGGRLDDASAYPITNLGCCAEMELLTSSREGFTDPVKDTLDKPLNRTMTDATCRRTAAIQLQKSGLPIPVKSYCPALSYPLLRNVE